MPSQVLELTALRNLFLGGNRIEELTPGIAGLRRLRVLYLGGNRLRALPAEITHLAHLHALLLGDNRLESLPESICCLRRLECLQLHGNRLTTLPHGLIHLDGLTELTIKENPLVNRFIREMSFQPPSLLELAARVLTVHRVPVRAGVDVPAGLHGFLRSSRCCVNPACKGVYFDTKVEHVRFVDFCGKYRVPLMQYLCSPLCRADRPAEPNGGGGSEEAGSCSMMKRVLLG